MMAINKSSRKGSKLSGGLAMVLGAVLAVSAMQARAQDPANVPETTAPAAGPMAG